MISFMFFSTLKSLVCPLLIDLKNSDLQGPLSQFNTAGISREEILRLIQSINARFPEDKRRTEVQLVEAFDVWWPRLEEKLTNAVNRSDLQEPSQPKPPKRPIEDILDEILEITRQTAHELRSPTEAYLNVYETSAFNKSRPTAYTRGTVGYFAAELGKPPEILMEQLAAAGIEKTDANTEMTEKDKEKLLAYLKAQHGTADKNRKMIILSRNR